MAEVGDIFPDQEIQAKLAGVSLPEDPRRRMAVIGRARKEIARELFPQAANIEVIEASKFASHLAFGERSQKTGYVVSRIFERLSRSNTGAKAA